MHRTPTTVSIHSALRNRDSLPLCLLRPSFRLIPDQPPIRRPVVSSEPRDATPPVFDQPAIRRPGVSSEPQDFIPVKRETPPIFDQPLIRRPVVSSEPRALISSEQRDVTPPIFDEQPMRRPVISSEQRDFAPPPIRRPLVSSEQRDATPSISMDHSSLQRSTSDPSCPLCRTAFDVSGVFRPVNDACGHTTCFQCFKSTMIKGTGCILCQEKEEDQSSSMSLVQVSDLD